MPSTIISDPIATSVGDSNTEKITKNPAVRRKIMGMINETWNKKRWWRLAIKIIIIQEFVELLFSIFDKLHLCFVFVLLNFIFEILFLCDLHPLFNVRYLPPMFLFSCLFLILLYYFFCISITFFIKLILLAYHCPYF